MVPPDISYGGKVQKVDQHLEDDTSVSNSVMESRSRSEHSDEGFEESDPSDVGNVVSKMVSRFIDRVCTEGGVTTEHIKNLHAMVPGVVHMHIEMLESVYRESKRLPPVQKAKIQSPILLSGEDMVCEPVRVYLITDGRDENSTVFLPAEGALFLTNYRIIFKGIPCDPLACEHSIVRSFPVASLTKEKRISGLYLSHSHQTLAEGLQLRSCTFQLIKLAFDEEVNSEQIESLRKLIMRTRFPSDIFGYFAFACPGTTIKTPMHKVKEKNATLKGFAKKTLLRTAKKAGFIQKSTTKKKYVLPPDVDFDESHLNNDLNRDDDDEDSVESHEVIPKVTIKDTEKLHERRYVRDWKRLGFFDPQSNYKMSTVNCNYSLCTSYPAAIVSPSGISDDSLKFLARCYKNQRIPLATWKHANGAVLMRGSVPIAKGVMGRLKGHPSNTNATTDISNFQEQDRYFFTIIDSMPHTLLRHQQKGLSDSNLSINSLLFAVDDSHFVNRNDAGTLTPEVGRKVRSVSQLNGRSFITKSKWGSIKATNHTKQPHNDKDSNQYSQFNRVLLYVLGEKSQSKSARLSEMYAEFIPVDYVDVRHTRLAFKKLMRTCLPSAVNIEPDQSFAKLLESSDWLQQIRGLLQLSGAVVDLIDLQGSSVTLALEDGWDITAQISSLAQLCLDPFYRTIEGFRVLIEKEWLAFGHRFGHRSNLKTHNNSSSFAPVFLQFLDTVHQIQYQFPLAFEFNEFYLRFLAYHSVSCRFRTFLFDCEFERVELGITALEDKRGSLNSRHVIETCTGSDDESIYPGGLRNSNTNTLKMGHSIFEFIERQHSKSPIFYNFMYTPDPERQVLRPQISVSMLELWRYYIDEELAHGPPYDPELITIDPLDEEVECNDKNTKRRVVTGGYDSLDKCIPDIYTRLLDEFKHVESERGLLPQKWRQVWEKLELPHSDSLTRNASFSSELVRSHGRLLHKRYDYIKFFICYKL